MIIPIALSFKSDKVNRLAFKTNRIIKSKDVNSVEFHITIEGLELTNNYTAKVISIFNSTNNQANADCTIKFGKIIYKPDTKLISMYETVTNHVYVYHANQSLDVGTFIYHVDLSKLDETALKVKEVYDQSYEDLLVKFDQAFNDYKGGIRSTMSEVTKARGSYSSLGSRLNDQISRIASGSPKGVYDNLTDLRGAYPNGTNGIFVTISNGHWYYWNSSTSAWTDGGAYQSSGLPDNSITLSKLSIGLQSFYEDFNGIMTEENQDWSVD